MLLCEMASKFTLLPNPASRRIRPSHILSRCFSNAQYPIYGFHRPEISCSEVLSHIVTHSNNSATLCWHGIRDMKLTKQHFWDSPLKPISILARR